jgi:hypothetical protein
MSKFCHYPCHGVSDVQPAVALARQARVDEGFTAGPISGRVLAADDLGRLASDKKVSQPDHARMSR